MGKQYKPDMASLIKRIIREASLPKPQEEMVTKLSRQQLLELLFYITELKHSNEQLRDKVIEMNDKNDGEVRGKKSIKSQ